MFVNPEQVNSLAKILDPHAEVTDGHARAITDIGFHAGHTGQDYRDQGTKLAAGVDGIVAMLNSWSAASTATAAALRTAASTYVTTDDQHGAQLQDVAGKLA